MTLRHEILHVELHGFNVPSGYHHGQIYLWQLEQAKYWNHHLIESLESKLKRFHTECFDCNLSLNPPIIENPFTNE